MNGAEALVAPGRINPIYLEGKLLPLQASTAAELNLRDGQVVQALVRLQDGQPMLMLKDRLLAAPGLAAAQDGQSIWLRVQNKSNGAWALNPITNSAPSALQTVAARTSIWTPTLAPPTAAPPSLISRISTLLYRPEVSSELSELFQPGTLDKILSSVPRPDLQAQWRGLQLSMAQLTPLVLRQAMMSAMGAEVWLARGMPHVGPDAKQLLRKLIAEMQQIESVEDVDDGVIEKLTRAVDDIEAGQVQAVQAQAQQEVLFSMTLPFVDANPVELTFRRGPKQDGEQPVLTVNVHSKSPDLGPIWLKTQLMSAQQVELVMWAEKASVAAEAKARSFLLGDELQIAGLNMRSFQVIHGSRPPQNNDWTPSGRGLVVDVSA